MAEEIRKVQQKQVNAAKKVSPQKKETKPSKSAVFKSEGKKTNSAKGISVEKGKNEKTRTITLKSGLMVNVEKGHSVTTKEGVVSLMPSGRYTVKGKDGKTRYYSSNGTELKESYFKQVESWKNDDVVRTSKGVAVNINKRLATTMRQVENELKDVESHQGLIGKAWSGLKNTFSFGDSSDKVREQLKEERKLLKQFNEQPQNRAKIFKQLTGLDYTDENKQKFAEGKIRLNFKSAQNLEGYKEGQKVAVDVASDVGSGIAAFGIYTVAVAAAPVTGGASIAVGIAAAGAVGAATKVAIKAGEAAVGGYEYNSLGSDLLMGSVNGAIAPLTAGAGGAVAKTVAVRAGVQVVKETGKQATKQVISSATKNAAKQGFARTFKANLAESVLQPNNYKLVGGTLSKRLGAYAAEGAVDGALSGGAYSGVETAKNGGSAGEIVKATAIGFGMGAIMGGAMTSLAHSKGVITGNKGAAETLEDAAENSIAMQLNKAAENNLEDIDILKNLSEKERTEFLKEVLYYGEDIFQSEASCFFLFAKGKKPATILEGGHDAIYSKIKNENIDIVTRWLLFADGTGIENAFLINKNSVKNIIGDNKELFAYRVGLSKDASIDDIYAKLTSKESPLKNENENQDIIGLILGYPKYNTMLYKLEAWLKDNHYVKDNFRSVKPSKLQEMFKKALYSPNSPYKDMSEKFKSELLEKIKEIKHINNSEDVLGKNSKAFPFVYYVEEATEINRIKNALNSIIVPKVKNADEIIPTPKPQGVKNSATMSNKKLQNNIADKMGKKDYEYYKKLDKEFFSDNTNLRLTSNFLNRDIENTAFLELRTQLKSISKNNPQLKNLMADLSNEGLSSKDVLKYLREFNNLNKKNVNLDINTINSILRMQKSGMDSDSLLSFIKLKIDNPNIKSFDLLKNYSSRYAQFSNKLNTISSNDIINEFRLLIKDAEFEGNSITRQDLKEIISNVKIEHSGFNKDELILAKFDKEMFDDMSKIIDNTPLNESENLSEYLIRIDKIRKEQNKLKETVQFEANKDVIKQNYNSSETPLNEIMLTPEELAEFNSKKDYYIKKAGDPSTKQGMGVSYDFNKEQKFLSKGLQNYERYNSRKYFAQNPEMKPYGKTGDYEYVPVIRFLDLEKSRFNTIQDLVESFPEKGGSYQANALKCCFTTPVGGNESQIISDVIIEIHPLSEISQGHLVGGWGREVRYSGNQKFKVIDKYCKVEEADFGSGIKREVKGHVVLQEMPPANSL